MTHSSAISGQDRTRIKSVESKVSAASHWTQNVCILVSHETAILHQSMGHITPTTRSLFGCRTLEFGTNMIAFTKHDQVAPM